MTNVEHQSISCNGETFTQGTYNAISVIIRDSDGFINATAMCKQFNRRFAKINENNAWKTYLEAFKRKYEGLPGMGDPIYFLRKGCINECQGTYVHPKLINYIAIWASPEYALTVGEIMDTINEYGQVTNQSFDETKDQLIAQLQTTINEQRERIQQLETKIEQTSTPDENCDKDLYIVRVGQTFKVSADSTHPPSQFIRHYIFPASMNVRQLVREHFNLRYNDIPNDSLEEVMTFINDLHPKFRE